MKTYQLFEKSLPQQRLLTFDEILVAVEKLSNSEAQELLQYLKKPYDYRSAHANIGKQPESSKTTFSTDNRWEVTQENPFTLVDRHDKKVSYYLNGRVWKRKDENTDNRWHTAPPPMQDLLFDFEKKWREARNL